MKVTTSVLKTAVRSRIFALHRIEAPEISKIPIRRQALVITYFTLLAPKLRKSPKIPFT
jgi:hypothetical protein